MEKADRTVTGVIFNIQKFSVNDGPGIRTVVFFKGCPLRCRWCANPESQLTKVQVLWDHARCRSCHHCVQVCPSQAMSLKGREIRIDHMKCTSCGVCVKECPAHALKTEGETKTVQEVMNVVMQDEVFYEESGGGITLSGGEMLAQPAFARELLKAAKEEGLHTCCETTGFADPEVFASVIQYIDYVLFDVKHWNPSSHKEGTGVTNEKILANLKYAAEQRKNVLVRIPVIPGFNDSLNDAREISRCLREARVYEAQLLPFHQFGENKYDLLGSDYAYAGVNALHKEDLDQYVRTMKECGIRAFV